MEQLIPFFLHAEPNQFNVPWANRFTSSIKNTNLKDWWIEIAGAKLVLGRAELAQVMNNSDFWKDSMMTQDVVVYL
jgi:hypothetical protein